MNECYEILNNTPLNTEEIKLVYTYAERDGSSLRNEGNKIILYRERDIESEPITGLRLILEHFSKLNQVLIEACEKINGDQLNTLRIEEKMLTRMFNKIVAVENCSKEMLNKLLVEHFKSGFKNQTDFTCNGLDNLNRLIESLEQLTQISTCKLQRKIKEIALQNCTFKTDGSPNYTEDMEVV